MTVDQTEEIRRQMVGIINSDVHDREGLEKYHGEVWDTKQLCEEYSVLGFLSPFVVVERKEDGVQGTLMFQHYPRFYWGFRPHEER